MNDLLERVAHLLSSSPKPELSYYATSLSISTDGQMQFGCQSHWVGYTEDTPPREIREASLMDAERVLASWRALDEPGLVVHEPDDMLLYFAYGGNAVIESQLALSVIPDWLRPGTSLRVGQFGYASPKLLGDAALRKAPTPRHRMRIIERDGYKCRVCGRSPSNYTDVELHVHHIRPWAAGGVTEDSNLMTLCHTCHNGLDPHFKFSLFRLIAEQATPRSQAYAERLRKYQALAAQRHSEA